MSRLDLLLEAEKRGILPQKEASLLAEARARNLIPQQESSVLDKFTSGVVRGAAGGALGLMQATGTEKLFGGDPELAAMAVKDINQQNKGTGFVGTAGELIGDPRNLATAVLPGGLAMRAAQSAGLGLTNPSEKIGKEKTAESLISAGLYGLGTAALGGVSKIWEKVSPGITSDMVKNAATKAYEFASKNGGVLKPETRDIFLNKVTKLIPHPDELAETGGTSPILDKINELMVRKGEPLSLRGAQALDEHLSDMIDSTIQKSNGMPNKIGQRFQEMQNALRDMMYNVSEGDVIGGKAGFDALKRARELWSTQIKLRDIEKIITRASLTDVPATSIKSGFRTLFTNPSKMRGYSDVEKKAIQNAFESGAVADLLKTFGSRLGPIITMSAGGGLGASAAAQIGSMAARNLASKVGAGKAVSIADKIAQGAKLTTKEIGQLPPKQAQDYLKSLYTTIAVGKGLQQ